MKGRIRVKDLHHRHFQGLLGQRFGIKIGKRRHKATLIDVTHLGPKQIDTAAREPFSLVFQLDEGVAQEADVYDLAHRKLGNFELLMTPLAPDGEASYLEVVFA